MNTTRRIKAGARLLAVHHNCFLPEGFPRPAHQADPYLIRRDQRLSILVWLLTESGWRRLRRSLPPSTPNQRIRDLWFEFKGRLLGPDATLQSATNAIHWLVSNVKRGPSHSGSPSPAATIQQ